jgi:hypothetical protein
MHRVGLEEEDMRTVILVVAIAMAQASLGCAIDSCNKYLTAKNKYENCFRANDDRQKCRLLHEEADQAARRYARDAFFPRIVEAYLNSGYEDPIVRN